MPGASSTIMTPRPLDGLRVLLAEDTTAVRRLYESVLRAAGASVEAVPDGLTAFRTWERALMAGRPFRLALVDYGMPYLNGAGLTAMLRAAGFSGPIIGMTAGVGEAEEALWRECGCDSVLAKTTPMRHVVDSLVAIRGEAIAEESPA